MVSSVILSRSVSALSHYVSACIIKRLVSVCIVIVSILTLSLSVLVWITNRSEFSMYYMYS